MKAAVVTDVSKAPAYADFPAHDMPDGMTFTYPMNFDFQPDGANQ